MRQFRSLAECVGGRRSSDSGGTMNFRKLAILGTALLVISVPSFANVCGVANQLYCQEFDGTGNAFSSQNDTASFGLFAQVYDNFRLAADTTVSSVHWEGE